MTDDNFASIEAAVEEGRTVYLNLKKAIAFVLPVNGGESLTILAFSQLPLLNRLFHTVPPSASQGLLCLTLGLLVVLIEWLLKWQKPLQ